MILFCNWQSLGLREINRPWVSDFIIAQNVDDPEFIEYLRATRSTWVYKYASLALDRADRASEAGAIIEAIWEGNTAFP